MSLVVAAPMAVVDLAGSSSTQQQKQKQAQLLLQQEAANKQQAKVAAAAEQQQKQQGRDDDDDEDDDDMSSSSSRFRLLMKGVRHLSDSGITRLPDKYILPAPERPGAAAAAVSSWSSSSSSSSCLGTGTGTGTGTGRVKLPVVDLACLRDPSQRAAVLATLDAACRDYGFFQVVNHGVGGDVTGGMLDVARRFFELPLSERSRYMSSDVRAKVRYGTSFNQAKDAVLCWRDFLKLVCQPPLQEEVAPCWPRQPAELRDVAATYAAATHGLFMELMEAALEALLGGGVPATMVGELAAPGGSAQMMTVNCYPACPQPELTLGMPPHSDYGLLTLVLQDHVEGLQVMTPQDGRWLTVDPIPGAFVVNVGDHLEVHMRTIALHCTALHGGYHRIASYRIASNIDRSSIEIDRSSIDRWHRIASHRIEYR
ncbi:hypothetical protein U9M48_037793 [Paspalum notatum var. saurae]|uniref:Fe2OG dioxygenase domain-containing protein n=1 Tax=Paspalum notatum var. saurae TaxID=547442 RepID=A0AAQ3UFR7_PASNO